MSEMDLKTVTYDISKSVVFESFNYGSKIIRNLNNLRISEALCDVVLVVEGIRIPAHRVWLASCSNYFRAMFTNQMAESRQQEIQMVDIDERTLRNLIDFCYTGSIRVDEENVHRLLPAACLLQMEEIENFCCRFLKDQLDFTNCLSVRNFAESHACGDLFKESDKFMRKNLENILKQEEYLQLPVDSFSEILSFDEVNLTDETAFNAVINWVKFDPETRKESLYRLLEHVRLPQCSKKFVVQVVSENPLIKKDIRCRDLVDEAKNALLLPSESNDASNERLRRRRTPEYEQYFIFAVGGWHSGDAMSNVERMDVRTGDWTNVKPMQKSRCGVGVGVINNKLFAVGGHDGQKYLKCVEKYDPIIDLWSSEVVPMSTCRTSVGVAVLDNSLYAIGGQDGVSCLSVVERYDPVRNEWIGITPMSSRRLGVSVSILNGCLYAIGGADGHNPLDSVERLDPRVGRWEKVKTMGTTRKHLGSASLKNSIFAVGGRTDNSELASAEKYDPRMDEWMPIVSLNHRRSGVGLAVINDENKIYAIGGFDGCNYLKSIEILEEKDGLDDLTKSSQWRNSGSMIHRRLGGGVGVITLKNEFKL